MLPLGTLRRGSLLRLTDQERSRHIHVVGASGSGKSKLLEAMIRDDILRGRGLCLIDPHGTLADEILGWCAAFRLSGKRRIHVIDLKNERWSAGFNPLRTSPGQEIETRVDAMVAACAEVWGGEDLDRTPLLGTSLQLLFYALAATNLTLAEALDLSAAHEGRALRERIVENLPNPTHRAYWREYNALSRRDFEERFSSARRRMLRFLATPSVRRMIGQSERVIDAKRIMDGSEILIVNLSAQGAASAENARLVGTLLMSELRLSAMARDPTTARARPFSLYIDECYDYLTGDVERMLDETRKFGLHVVLSHQRLGQLRARGDAIFNGVMAGGQTKIVFGGMGDADAELMAREVFRSTFQLERPKHVLDKPVVIDEIPYWLESESESEGAAYTSSSSETFGWNSGESFSSSEATGWNPAEVEAASFLNPALPISLTESFGYGTSAGRSGGISSAKGETTSTSRARGRSQTLKPVRVMMPTAVHSLDEELHLAIRKLRELPMQAAIAKRPGKPPVRFRPTTIKPPLVRAERAAAFVEEVREQSDFIVPSFAADAEIEARGTLLGVDQRASANDDPPFWQ